MRNEIEPPLTAADALSKAAQSGSKGITETLDFGLLKAWRFIFQDAKINSPKIKCFLILFRIATFFEHRKRNPLYRALYYFSNTFYCLFADLFVGGAELPAGTQVGSNLAIHHGYGLVVGKSTRIKDNVILRQGVTIGNYVDRSGRLIGEPTIESGVEFGAGACALGKLTIGEGAFVGANCVVFRDIQAGERVYPARPTVCRPDQVSGTGTAETQRCRQP